MEPEKPVVRREDKYNITINGFRVRATEEQEKQINSLTSEQITRLQKVLGEKDGK